MLADLDAVTLTQEAFGLLVGISQPAVSDLMTRGVIQAGDTGGAWLRAYCAHLREQAAGRGADGELASERARLAREQADAVAMRNAQTRRELVPVALAEAALAHIGRQVATRLEAIVPQLRRRVPDMPPEALRYVEEEVARARSAAAALKLADADQPDPDDEDEA